MKLSLTLSPDRIAICKLPARAPVPTGFLMLPFFSISRTQDELSIVLSETHIQPGWTCDRGWRMLKVEGPFEFDVVGVVATLSAPLADARIPIFVISTFDTDYLLVKEDLLQKTADHLRESGHTIYIHEEMNEK